MSTITKLELNQKRMHKYKTTIGMEVHCELKTASKMFSWSKNDLGQGETPNTDIDVVTTAQPGTLPVPNMEAVKYVQMAGLALGCTLRTVSKFDRKNYFYPDLPKGYQISQYDQPFCEQGSLDVFLKEDGGEQSPTKNIGITRIHLEEDTGKSQHPDGTDYTLVDLNRAGVPLMELVTEPDIETGRQARVFCQRLQQVFRYLGISDADMERGQMRCEVNISLYKEGEDRLSGTKVEIKNLNSFKSVERAVNYEIQRQSEALEHGEEIVQETRGWHDGKQMTISQRAKESAHDYRYFPEPDIPPMRFSEEEIEALRRSLPELPDEKRARFKEQYGVSSENLDVIVSEKPFADYFEHVVSDLHEKIASKEVSTDEKKCVKLAANYLVSELQAYLVKENKKITDISISPENFSELIGFVADGKINSSGAQTVLSEMLAGSTDDPSQIIEAKNLLQMDDDSELESVVGRVIEANPQSVEDYKAGKENALKFLMGQVMKETKGRANPQKAMEMIRARIGE